MFENGIRQRRQELNLSQTKLARMVEIPASTLSDIELGKRQPWPKVRADLSKALGVTQAQLFPSEQGGQDG